MELGCGIGLLGLVIASLQASTSGQNSSLHMTDVVEGVLSTCQRNVMLPTSVYFQEARVSRANTAFQMELVINKIFGGAYWIGEMPFHWLMVEMN